MLPLKKYLQAEFVVEGIGCSGLTLIIKRQRLSSNYFLDMKNRPLPVIMVSVLFILTGCVGFVYHIKDFLEPNDKPFELIWVLILRILAVVCGLLLLFRINWARWLAIAWLAYHVIISAFNSISEMVAHIVFLIIISVLLFLPVSSTYFRIKTIRENASAA